MKNIKVIKVANLPVRLPILATIVWWLLLDRLHAPALAWGIFLTLATIVWVVAILVLFNQEPIDLFKRDEK